MLATLIAAIGQGSPALIARRVAAAAIVYAMVGLLVACGVGFLVAAGFVAAERRWGGIKASAGFGLGFIVLAIIVFAIYRIVVAMRARRLERERKAAQMSSLIAAALALVPTLLRSRAGLAELLAPVVVLLAYMIYKENARPAADETPPPE